MPRLSRPSRHRFVGGILFVLLLLPGRLANAQSCESFRLLPPRELLAGTGWATVRVQDATGDGRPDLLALAQGGKTIYAGVQRADGTFAPSIPLATQALDLLAADFLVYLAVDGLASRYTIDHEMALRRLEGAGAIVTTVETCAFEWMGGSHHPQFKAVSALVQERMKAL